MLSPPLAVIHSPLPHEGHGGMLVFEFIVISFPQFAQRYVPADTSLPAGIGSATASCLPVVDAFLNAQRLPAVNLYPVCDSRALVASSWAEPDAAGLRPSFF